MADEAAPPAQNGTAPRDTHIRDTRILFLNYTRYAHKYIRLPVNTNTKIHK